MFKEECMSNMKYWLGGALLTALWLGAGCASMNIVESEVATFSQWPAGRKPATYAFERLPSQQANPERQASLEAAARPALAAAGFTPAAEPKTADVTVQLAARSSRADISAYDDPFWWRGGLYVSRHGRRAFRAPYGHYAGPSQLDSPRYEREAALLIRDRASNAPLYEVRATTEGYTPGNERLTQLMFTAAMSDFPYAGTSPRSVRAELH